MGGYLIPVTETLGLTYILPHGDEIANPRMSMLATYYIAPPTKKGTCGVPFWIFIIYFLNLEIISWRSDFRAPGLLRSK